MKFRQGAVAVFTITLLASGCNSSVKVGKSGPGHTNPSSHETSHSQGNAYGHSQAKKNGPPSHAPAHGYRQKFQYVHYKQANVYYSEDRNIWFWIEGGSWKVGTKLPGSIKVNEGVEIEIDSETPYTHHALSYNAPRYGRGKSNRSLTHEKGERPNN